MKQQAFRIVQLFIFATFWVGSTAGAYSLGYYHGHSAGYFKIGEDYKDIYRSYRRGATTSAPDNANQLPQSSP